MSRNWLGLSAFVSLLLALTLFVAGFGTMVSWTEAGHEAANDEETAVANIASATRDAIRADSLATQATIVSFSREIQPLLQLHCTRCHGPNSSAGSPPNGLQLDTYENVMLGSLFLPVVVPGQPQNSSLILLMRSGGMPAQANPLPEETIRLIALWIQQGALNN